MICKLFRLVGWAYLPNNNPCYNFLMFCKFLSVFIGGGVGALLRFIASLLSKKYFMAPIFGTFFVNILGCFLLGLVFGLTLNKINMSETLKLFITVGFLGGLTTFSTFNLEVLELLKAGKIGMSFLYIFLSCIFGLLFTYLGYLVSKV